LTLLVTLELPVRPAQLEDLAERGFERCKGFRYLRRRRRRRRRRRTGGRTGGIGFRGLGLGSRV
jgi:hypothetical protein